MADAALDEYYKEMDEAEQAGHHEIADKIYTLIQEKKSQSTQNYGPAKPIPTSQANLGMQTAAADMPPSDSFEAPSYSKDLAGRGVDVTSGAPAGNFAASFSPSKASRLLTYQNALSSYYKQPIRVDLDEKTGKLVYKDPSGNVRLIDDAPSPSSPIASQVGKTLPAAGAIGGSMTGMPWLGSIAGAGVGKGAQMLGAKALGADQGEGEPISAKTIGKESIDASLAEARQALPWLAGIKMPGLVSFFVKGVRPIKPEVASTILEQSAKSEKLVNDVQEAAGSGFNPDMAQRSGNYDALKMREAMENDPKYNSPFVQRQQGNVAAIQQGVTNQSNIASPMSAAVSGTEAGALPQQIGMEAGRGQAMAENRIAETKGELGKILSSMPNTTRSELADALTPALQSKLKDMTASTTEEYNHMRITAKNADPMPPEFFATPDGMDWRNTVDAYKAKIKRGLSVEERESPLGRTLPKLPNPMETQEEALFRELGIPKDMDRSISMEALNDHIQNLREKIRQASLGRPVAGQNTPDLMELRDRAVAARAAWLRTNNPELLNRIESAETASRSEAELRNNMIANGFTKAVHGETDPEAKAGILDAIIRNGDVGAARQLSMSVGHDAEAVSTLDNFATAYFKRMFKPNKAGEQNISPGQLNKAQYDTLQVLKSFMSPESKAAVEKSFDLQGQVNTQTIKLKNAQKLFAKSFEGRISKMNGEEISGALLSPDNKFGVTDAVKLKSLSDGAGLYEPTKAVVVKNLRDSITGVDGKDFNPDKLDSFVNNQDVVNKLRAFGLGSYVDKLKTLNDGMKLISKTSGGSAALPSERTKFSDFARTFYAKPMTAEGRALTLLQGMRKEAFARGIYNGLSSEEGLKNLVEMSKIYSDTNKFGALASSLNASGMADSK